MRELDHGARLDLAQRKRAGALLLRVRRPGIREVAVEVGLVVREEVRRRHVAAVEILDDAFRIDLVVRRRIVDRARQQQARELGRLDHLAARVAHAHRQRESVAVDVVAAPVRVGPRRPFVARHRAHVAAVREHRLRAVGRHPRQHVEAHVAQARAAAHRGGRARSTPRRPARGAAGGRPRRSRARRSTRRARSRACCRRPTRTDARDRDRDRASAATARVPPACGRSTSRGTVAETPRPTRALAA